MIRNETKEEQEKAIGTCYVRAFHYLAKLPKEQRDKAKLVHGKIVGRIGSDNVRFGHAWVELGGDVIELLYHKKKPRITLKQKYYRIYRVSNTKKYTAREMYEVGLKNGGTFGSWPANRRNLR